MYKNYLKRFLDFIIAILAFPFWIIILIIIGSIIYFQDKGSIFYNAPRLGKDGKVFLMYKFRSMKMNAPDIRNDDGSTFNAKDDQRLTMIGKFIRNTSIDETPQILNIIKGDMSIIGPRPDLPEHVDIYDDNEARKLEVRPGVTGYNQAYFRNAINCKLRWINDVYYVDNISLIFDLKIMIKTIITVIRKKGLYTKAKIALHEEVKEQHDKQQSNYR